MTFHWMPHLFPCLSRRPALVVADVGAPSVRWGENRESRAGFTLIEILLVVIILGILASLVVPRLAGRTEAARREAARSDIEGGIALALDLYEADNGGYPAGLSDLIREPSDAKNWKGPYLKKGLPRDPWGNAYLYRAPGLRNPTWYDLFSLGRDGQEGTEDDVANWKEAE